VLIVDVATLVVDGLEDEGIAELDKAIVEADRLAAPGPRHWARL